MTTEEQAIEKLIKVYRNTLERSDAAEMSALFTMDGVVMPPNAPQAKGQEQLKATYEFLFKAVQVTIQFSIAEILVTGDYAFAQTTSTGTSLIHSSGQTLPINNKELFIFKQVNGTWKIFKYMFNQQK